MKNLPILLSLMTCFSMVGCDQSGQNQKPQEDAKIGKVASKVVGEKIAEYVSPLPADAPVYKVATTGNQPPFSFLHENGKLQGIDIDAIRLIGEEEGFKVEFYKEPWQNVFPSVVSGERDLAISGISYNDERASQYTLSDSYLFVPSAIMYKNPKLKINGLSDLAGLKFGGMEAAKQVGDVEKNVQNVTIDTSTTMFQAFTKLMRGDVDAIAEDLQWLQYTAFQHPEEKFLIVEYETEKDAAAQQIVMMKKGNTGLAEKINSGIEKLKEKNQFSALEDKWLHQNAKK